MLTKELQRQIRLLCDDAADGLCRIPDDSKEECPYPNEEEKCGLCYTKAIIALLEEVKP